MTHRRLTQIESGTHCWQKLVVPSCDLMQANADRVHCAAAEATSEAVARTTGCSIAPTTASNPESALHAGCADFTSLRITSLPSLPSSRYLL